MKNSDLYARLELITPEFDHSLSLPQRSPKVTQVWGRSKAYLERIGQLLLRYFCGSSELRIVTKRDGQGNDYFAAYDPISQAHHTFTSEQALRVWLDERYYH
ncbi:MAG: hypothetical protein AAGE59_08885 [Cyanobacteria bacterium P01_F01_bin.86]